MKTEEISVHPIRFYHYYETKRGAFFNLSDLSPDEAEKVLDSIRQEGKTFASKRSLDYMDIRRELEQKARALFIEKGGVAKRMTPHYMTLDRCPWLLSWYEDGREIAIPAKDFDLKAVSFTYGDLFPTMRFKDEKPYREKVYTYEEILGVIDEFGYPQVWNVEGKLGPERYIEVQVWDDDPIQTYKGLKD